MSNMPIQPVEPFPVLRRTYPKLDPDKLLYNWYLVIYPLQGMVQNVGKFLAKDTEHAIELARKAWWNTNAKLEAHLLEDLKDGWSYFN